MYIFLFRRSGRSIYATVYRLVLVLDHVFILRLILIILVIALITGGGELGQSSEGSIYILSFLFLRDIFLFALPFNHLRPRRQF
jgi:hypothetical protein